jgi:hypothetical protein
MAVLPYVLTAVLAVASACELATIRVVLQVWCR